MLGRILWIIFVDLLLLIPFIGLANSIPNPELIALCAEAEERGTSNPGQVKEAENKGFLAPIDPIPSDLPQDMIVHIKTADELAKISGSSYCVLDNDIHLTAEWVPIQSFSGTLDGRGYCINNLFILESSDHKAAGLFGELTSSGVTIKNLGINIGEQGVTGTWVAGGLIACYYTEEVAQVLSVNNCYVTGDVFLLGSLGDSVGGLIGGIDTPGAVAIINCYTTSNVSAGPCEFYVHVGGLIGTLSLDTTVRNCYAIGNVSARSEISAVSGGLIGHVGGDKNKIEFCYATGEVLATGSQAYAGGLVGLGNGKISYCFVLGDTVSNASNAADSYAGGLLGYIPKPKPKIESSYRLSTQKITGTTIEESGTLLSAEQMKSQASFVGWNFTDDWEMGRDYPLLKGFDTNKGE